MPVSSEHKQYTANLDKWKLVRDVISSHVQCYIKSPDITDQERTARYVRDAQFTNFTGRTKNSLVGAIFRRTPLVDIPLSVEYIEEDVTGSNESIVKLSQEIVGEVLQTGRYGILTDYPAIEDPQNISAQDSERLNIKARLYRYTAEAIINWRVEKINGSDTLTLVVLSEPDCKIDPDDPFEWIESTIYRVLTLSYNGETDRFEYSQVIFDEDGEPVSQYTPLDASGNPLELIPFEFVGAEDNDADVDPSPLYDLSRLNVGHLQNSADYEESIHIIGQPTLVISSPWDPTTFADANPGGVKMGSRRGINVGAGGKAVLLQPSPNQLADEAMRRKEQQAIMMGAKLITPQATNETAEAARMRHSGETSILSTIAHNVEMALTKSIWHLLRFTVPNVDTMVEEAVLFKLNNEFFDANLDPNMIMAQIQLAEKGIIAQTDIRNTLRKFGQLDDSRTDSDILADAEAQPVMDDGDTSLATSNIDDTTEEEMDSDE
jgi:hypothetical protein